MNLFSTELFLRTAGEVLFSSRTWSIEVFRLEGRLLRLLVVDGRVVRTMPFYDFPQPLDEVVLTGPVRELSYFPRTVVRTTTIAQRTPEAPGYLPSPYIDWAHMEDYAAFEHMVAHRGGTKTGDSKRQKKRLERDVGPISFVFDDQRPEVLETCMRWKSGQYLASGLGDMFAAEENRTLFRRLQAHKAVVVTSLSAGSKLVAAHLGCLNVEDGHFGWWIPAYDPAYGKYSPGRLMLELMIQESHQRGHREFDFLIGDESYKFVYSTHNRVIGPLGRKPLREIALSELRRQGKAVLERSPRALDFARTLRSRLRKAGH